MFFVITLCFRETKSAHGAMWGLIFDHNSSNGDFFTTGNDPFNINKPYMYSIIGNLDNTHKTNGNFEFLLEYPQLNGYNRWIQSENPMNEGEVTGKKAKGYQSIGISWSGRAWGGLVRSVNSYTHMDGSAGEFVTWWDSIGCKSVYMAPNGFPGPCKSDLLEDCSVVTHVKLFVRITSVLTKQNMPKKLIHCILVTSWVILSMYSE